MTEEERRRCCLLGGCGCTAGSAAQRQAMKAWLVAKIAGDAWPPAVAAAVGEERIGDMIDRWLDELPWEKEEAS